MTRVSRAVMRRSTEVKLYYKVPLSSDWVRYPAVLGFRRDSLYLCDHSSVSQVLGRIGAVAVFKFTEAGQQ